jgi:hypothetical protein
MADSGAGALESAAKDNDATVRTNRTRNFK